jgi:hypothetical protein
VTPERELDEQNIRWFLSRIHPEASVQYRAAYKAQCRSLLEQNRPALDALAQHMLRDEVMTAKELADLLAPFAIELLTGEPCSYCAPKERAESSSANGVASQL